jgi:hypothetical protein
LIVVTADSLVVPPDLLPGDSEQFGDSRGHLTPRIG